VLRGRICSVFLLHMLGESSAQLVTAAIICQAIN
jgi:hypothetical protein